jgi:hypothetical protein
VALLHKEVFFFFFFKKTKISIFGGILNFLELIVFGQILVISDSFRQFWADFSTLAMANSMPKLQLKP